MDESYLASLIVFFFFGLAFFKKDTKYSSKTLEVNKQSNNKGYEKTGVARYLSSKQDEVSGVAKYLATKEAAEVPVTSVAKYVANQSALSEKNSKEKVTRVEKYLNNQK